MNKARQLRELLINSPLVLKKEDILLSLTDFKVSSTVGIANQHFEMSYTADLVLMNFSGEADVLAFVILTWLETAQPYRKDDAFFGTIDVLDSSKADVNIRIPLTEVVKVEFKEDGTALIHQDEPQIDATFPTKHWKLFVKDDLWFEWDQPL